MKEEKQGFIQWVKVHKKELIIAGISAAAIIGVIIGIKKREALFELWQSLQNQMSENPSVTFQNKQENFCKTEIIAFPVKHSVPTPIEVSEHLRNLPEGWNASAEKILSATEHGYQLNPGQTWVDTYTKNKVIA